MRAKALRNITIDNIHYKEWQEYNVDTLFIAGRQYFEAIKTKEVKETTQKKKRK